MADAARVNAGWSTMWEVKQKFPSWIIDRHHAEKVFLKARDTIRLPARRLCSLLCFTQRKARFWSEWRGERGFYCLINDY